MLKEKVIFASTNHLETTLN